MDVVTYKEIKHLKHKLFYSLSQFMQPHVGFNIKRNKIKHLLHCNPHNYTHCSNTVLLTGKGMKYSGFMIH